MKHIEKISKFFGKRNNFKGYLKQKYFEMSKVEYYQFLSKAYDYMHQQIIQSNEITMLDVIDSVYSDLLRKYYKSSIYNEIIDYLLTKHKDTMQKKFILKDTFCFLPEFLEQFTNLKQLKMSESKIDELSSYPTFYTDFLYYFNFERH